MLQERVDPIQNFSSISRAATELRIISHHIVGHDALPVENLFVENERIWFDPESDLVPSWFILTDQWIMFNQGESRWGIPFDVALAARIRELGAIVNVAPTEAVDRLSADTPLNVKIESDPLCYKCGSARLLMSGSLGLLCPDCYDEAEGFL